jgi:hypothetical protein
MFNGCIDTWIEDRVRGEGRMAAKRRQQADE